MLRIKVVSSVASTLPAILLLWVIPPVAAQAPVVRDSTGVTLIEHPRLRGATSSQLQLDAHAIVEIGSEAGGPELRFNRIVGIAQLSNGAIAVADRSSGEIRIFDRSGAFVRKMGGKGQGPGEFRLLAHIRALPGDSIVAADGIGNRLTVFDPHGKAVRTFSAAGAPPSGQASAAPPSSRTVLPGSFADGSFLAYRRASAPSGEKPSVLRDTLIVSTFSRDGVPLADIGRFPGPEVFRSSVMTSDSPSAGGTFSVSTQAVVFGRESFFGIGPDIVYVGDGSTYEVRGYDRSGRLRRIIRVAELNRPVTRSMIAELYADAAEAAGRPPAAVPAGTEPNAPPTPPNLPAYGALHVDAASRLWVKDYAAPRDTAARWVVFDPEGRRIGAVMAPTSFQPMHISRDTIAGVWRDELGVESVRVYRLIMQRATAP